MAEFNNNKDKSHSSIGLNNAKAIEDAKNNANKTIHPSSNTQHKDNEHHKSTHKHKQVNGNHSFVHPQEINKDNIVDNEQEVRCDCGKQVPVSLINQNNNNNEVAVIGQQSQNANNTYTKTATIIDKNSSGNNNKATLQVDTSTSPATVIENGVKSNANLYAHDQRVQDVINGKVQTTTKVVDTKNDEAQVNVLGTTPSSQIEKEAREKTNKNKK